MKAKINNSWVDIPDIYTKVSGDWKLVLAGYTKVNGTWKNIYQSCPYDARIAYLESNGTLYIDTGIILLQNDIVEINMTFLSKSSGDNFLLGASATGGGSIWIEIYKNKTYYVRYGSSSSASETDNAVNDVGKLRTYKVQNGYFYVNDFQKLTPDYSSMPLRNLYIFGRNGDTPTGGIGRIGETKIIRNGNVILNLIPVRVGQVGCMYDKVSKQLLYNVGTGSFVLGSDITPIQYIENTATSYINTLYKPNQNTRVIADVQAITSTNYGRLFGCSSGTSWNSTPVFQIDYETGSTGTLLYIIGNDTTWNTISSVTGDYNRHIYDLSTTTLKMDGVQIATHAADTFLCTVNLAIFTRLMTTGAAAESNFLKGRLYSFKIYEGGALVKDFIPVRSGSVGYLYDRVNDQLYGNSGAGDFTLGPDSTQ